MTRKSNAKSAKAVNSNPAPAVVVYKGPIRAPVTTVPNDLETVRLSFIAGQTGSSVGLQTYFGTSNLSSCPDWSKYQGIYDEFRILGFQLDYWPAALEGSSQNVSSSGMAVGTHSTVNPFPFTSVNTMCDYGNVKPFYTSKPCSLEWKMGSTEEAQFFPTSSSSTQGWLGFWAPGATSTTGNGYGYCLVSYVVQLRGRV